MRIKNISNRFQTAQSSFNNQSFALVSVIGSSTSVRYTMQNRVVMFKEQVTYDFNWSCRPILLWMRCLGIPLLDMKSLKKKSYWRYVLVILFTITCYVLNVGTHLYNMIEITSNNSSNYHWTTSDWNDVITLQNFRFVSVGTHTTLLFFTAVNWGDMIQTTKRLERLLKPKDYQKIRRASVVAVCVVLLVW